MKFQGIFLNCVLFMMLFFLGCTSESPESEEEFTGNISIPDSLLPEGDETYLYALPAPLQISSLLQAYNVPFNPEIDLLNPIRINNHSTTFEKSISLGCYIIDMGYLTIYEHFSESSKYLKAIEMLMDEIGIKNSIGKKMTIRLNNNINNKDSLSHIILESYKQSHIYFQNNGREGIGILLLAGCYIEGLYLATNVHIKAPGLTSKIMAQNKIFLNNIIELLNYYINNKEVYMLSEDLKTLRQAFDKVHISVNDTAGNAMQGVYDRATYHRIVEEAGKLRHKYVR